MKITSTSSYADEAMPGLSLDELGCLVIISRTCQYVNMMVSSKSPPAYFFRCPGSEIGVLG